MVLSIVDSLLIFVEIGETSIIGTLWKWSETSGPPLWFEFTDLIIKRIPF